MSEKEENREYTFEWAGFRWRAIDDEGRYELVDDNNGP